MTTPAESIHYPDGASVCVGAPAHPFRTPAYVDKAHLAQQQSK